MSREAMKQALDALMYIHSETSQVEDELIDDAILALSAALDAPEPEPVWIQRTHLEWARREPSMCRVEPTQRLPGFVPLYTAPREWQGLTDEEKDYIWNIVGNSDAHGDVDGWSGRDVINAIEAKLKEKNGG